MFERPRKFPHGSVCAPLAILWVCQSCRSITPTRHIVSRETLNSLSIHLSRSLFRPRAIRDLLSNCIAFVWTLDKGWNPARGPFLPHRRAGPRVSAKWGSVPESCGILVRQPRARGEEEERNRMKSAAALIGSQPCDVFIARASQGTGDNWVGSREWRWLH